MDGGGQPVRIPSHVCGRIRRQRDRDLQKKSECVLGDRKRLTLFHPRIFLSDDRRPHFRGRLSPAPAPSESVLRPRRGVLEHSIRDLVLLSTQVSQRE